MNRVLKAGNAASLTGLSLLFLVTATQISVAQTVVGQVVSVGDGDTIRVRTAEKVLTARIACIDAAEMAQRPYGEAASNRLKQLLPPGQAVTLRVADVDRYGRSVAKIYKDGLSINVALVLEGQAVVFRDYLGTCPELRDRLLEAEASAKARRLGMWAQSSPVINATEIS